MTCHPMGGSHILLTTDLSPESQIAFADTLALARITGARVTLLHAVPSTVPMLHGSPLMPSGPLVAKDAERIRHQLTDLAAALDPAVKLEVDTTPCSDVAEGILAYARSHGVDLIAMSTHGRGGLRRVVLGSVAEDVLRGSHLPLLLFPLASRPGRDAGTTTKRIVVPTDLSEASTRAFGPTVELARQLDLPITLLSVLVEHQVAPHASVLVASPTYPDLDALLAEREAKLKELAAELGQDVESETLVLAGSSASSVIVRYARENDAAFIAIATHGRSGIRRLVMGSVTESVLRHSCTPVIVFPPAEKDDETC